MGPTDEQEKKKLRITVLRKKWDNQGKREKTVKKDIIMIWATK